MPQCATFHLGRVWLFRFVPLGMQFNFVVVNLVVWHLRFCRRNNPVVTGVVPLGRAGVKVSNLRNSLMNDDVYLTSYCLKRWIFTLNVDQMSQRPFSHLHVRIMINSMSLDGDIDVASFLSSKKVAHFLTRWTPTIHCTEMLMVLALSFRTSCRAQKISRRHLESKSQ